MGVMCLSDWAARQQWWRRQVALTAARVCMRRVRSEKCTWHAPQTIDLNGGEEVGDGDGTAEDRPGPQGTCRRPSAAAQPLAPAHRHLRAVSAWLSDRVRGGPKRMRSRIGEAFGTFEGASSGVATAAWPLLFSLSSAEVSTSAMVASHAPTVTHEPLCPNSSSALSSIDIVTTAAAAASSSIPYLACARRREERLPRARTEFPWVTK